MKPWPDPKSFQTFKGFNEAWHSHFQKVNPDWKENDMYCNAQFDELPYAEWEKAGGTFERESTSTERWES